MAAAGWGIFTDIFSSVTDLTGAGLNYAASTKGAAAAADSGRYNLLSIQEQNRGMEGTNRAQLEQLKTGIIYLAIVIVFIMLFYFLIKWATK